MTDKLLNKSLADLLADQNLDSKIDILQKQGTNRNEVPLSKIRANPYQPRKQFDQNALEGLAQSIKEVGVFNPILIRPRDGWYEIVAGERRYRASILAGKETIPAIIENFSDQEMAEIALLENIQREQLNPLEIADSLHNYQLQYGYTQQELADKFGKSRPYIANLLRLRTLPDSIQGELLRGTLSAGHVRTLVGLDAEEAEDVVEQIKEKNLSVRETEVLVGQIKDNKKVSKTGSKESELANKTKAKVKLTNNEIKLSFSSKEEMEKYLKKLLNN